MALESNNAEMTKRLKYTKDILTHMLNNNNNGGTINSNNKVTMPGTAPITYNNRGISLE